MNLSMVSVEDYLDNDGHIVVPAGTTLTSCLEDNIATLGDEIAYRYLDFSHDRDGHAIELTWSQLGVRVRAVAGRLQQITARGDRIAILAPQGIDYVVAFFAAIEAGGIAVPLFSPELPGHTDRLDAVLSNAEPAVVLTTTEAAESVQTFLRTLPRQRRPRVVAVDAVPDSVGQSFTGSAARAEDIAYLQYTSGSTRTPAGVEITHRAVYTNVLQMIMSVGLDRDIRSVSWLPLFHDMGLLMIMFPALCGGHITLMSPLAFVRRPGRWLAELGRRGPDDTARTFAAAPNFAFELAAQRGLPRPGEQLDLSNVAGLINGSEPVNITSIERFTTAFAPYGLPANAVKPSYGMAEATLFVSTVDPAAETKAVWLDRVKLGEGVAVRVPADHRDAVAQVSCGTVARSQWAVIVDPSNDTELKDGQVGEIWLHGDNLGNGYWRNPDETDLVFGNKLQVRLPYNSHAEGAAVGGTWLRTGDLGVYIGGELFITGRMKDLVIIDGRNHYPQDIEATTAAASEAVRDGYVAAFSVPGDDGDTGEHLVIVAERAPRAGRTDSEPVIAEIRAAVSRTHALPVADVHLVAAGSIPRTTSGKLARRACRADYLAGNL